MENQIHDKVKQSIQTLRDKKARIYFLVQDTKGNAKASVRYIYQMAKALLDKGFNPIILHEKTLLRNDSTKLSFTKKRTTQGLSRG